MAGRKRGTGAKSKKERETPVDRPPPSDATLAANVRERRKAVANAKEEIYRIDCEVRSIKERDIAPLTADRSDILDRLQERFGIARKAFNLSYKVFQAEQDAKAGGDQPFLDTLAELFETEPSGQVSMGRALASTLPLERDAEEPFDDQGTAPERAYHEGRRAGEQGKNLDTCPYTGDGPLPKKLRAKFQEGWSDAQAERALQLGASASGAPALN